MNKPLDLRLLALVLASLAAALVISFAATPLVKRFARKVGAMDVPKDGRRMHDHPIPRLGGLAMFLGFLLSTLFFAEIDVQVRGMLLGCLVVVFAGVIDDIHPLQWWVKLLMQLAAAIIAVAHGIRIEVFTSPSIFNEGWLILGWLSVPITILWIVLVTNAVNLIDGLDGLAAQLGIQDGLGLQGAAADVNGPALQLLPVLAVEAEILVLLVQQHVALGPHEVLVPLDAPASQGLQKFAPLLLRPVHGDAAAPLVPRPVPQGVPDAPEGHQEAGGRGNGRRPPGDLHQGVGRRVLDLQAVEGDGGKQGVQEARAGDQEADQADHQGDAQEAPLADQFCVHFATILSGVPRVFFRRLTGRRRPGPSAMPGSQPPSPVLRKARALHSRRAHQRP